MLQDDVPPKRCYLTKLSTLYISEKFRKSHEAHQMEKSRGFSFAGNHRVLSPDSKSRIILQKYCEFVLHELSKVGANDLSDF